MKQIEKIFSKLKVKRKPSHPPKKTPIIVDIREKQSLVVANLIQKKANITFEKLEVGDYLINDTLIERKTFSDFASSIISKRLPEQLKNLRKAKTKFLIIEGFKYNYDESYLHENAIRGMLISIATEFKIPMIFTENERDTSNFLILTAKRYEKQKTNNPLRQSRIYKSIEEQKQFILEGFPGIGPTLSKKLLKKFGSLKNLFNAKEEEFAEIKNFHKEKIRKFKEILS